MLRDGVPDGTKVAITAVLWYRVSDGGYHNGSAGGTMLGGEATPNDGNFRTYTVTNGQVTATYSSEGVFVTTRASARRFSRCSARAQWGSHRRAAVHGGDGDTGRVSNRNVHRAVDDDAE